MFERATSVFKSQLSQQRSFLAMLETALFFTVEMAGRGFVPLSMSA